MPHWERRSLLLSLLLLIGYLSCNAQWKQQQFIVGAFQGPDPIPAYKNEVIDTAGFVNQVKLAHQAGFNFCTGNTRYSTIPSFQNLRYSLYQQYGIKSLYLSPYFGPPIIGTPSVRANNAFQFLIQLNPSSQKAVCGYNLIDEPPAGESDKVLAWVEHIKELDPDKLVFVNLYPVYAFDNDINQYNNYLQSYLDTTGSARLDVACFDFYPFVGNGSMRQLYFYNLQAVNHFADGRPVWAYVLTTPHWTYPTPDKFMLNFMVNCPLAYGVKGILYFTYQTIGYVPGMNTLFGNAIIDSLGNPTSLYNDVKSVNNYLSQVAGPVIMNSIHLGTYHVSNSVWGQYIQPENMVNDSMPVLASINNENILTGIFQSIQDNQQYDLFFVNKANRYLQNVYVALKGNYVNQISVARSGTNAQSPDLEYKPVIASYDQAANETWFFLDFQPGEGEMLKVQGVVNPHERVVIPSNVTFTLYPNPTDGMIKMKYSFPKSTRVKIELFDSSGRLIRTIQNVANLTKGDYHSMVNLTGLTPGLYFLTILTESSTLTEKVIFIK